MRSSLFATGLVGVAFAALWYLGGGPNPTVNASDTRVAAPVAHENLHVYFILGPDKVANLKLMTLQEALARELAVVHETSDVNTLAVENRSDEYELFIQSGDIVKGGQQDRLIASDMLLPPNSGVVPLPVHCVEQGRWSGRGTEDSRRFASSEKFAVGKAMKIANASGEQGEVWKTVQENQDKLNENLSANVNAAASPTSFLLTLEAPAVEAKVVEYEGVLLKVGQRRNDIIGVVFVVNGQVTGAEVYGSNALFRKAWPKLLNAAAVEAVVERTAQPLASAPSVRDIEQFLAQAAEPDGQPGLRHASELANGEVFQTEGRVPAQELYQTEGHVGRRPVYQQANIPNPAPQQVAGEIPQLFSFSTGMVGGSDNTRAPVPQPSPTANRLSSNRVDNNASLMIESSDPARNAVIRRSYIKK